MICVFAVHESTTRSSIRICLLRRSGRQTVARQSANITNISYVMVATVGKVLIKLRRWARKRTPTSSLPAINGPGHVKRVRYTS
ncbi:hypothetical protein KCP76_13635 [Salmonella enterica subsp. enterica serovar Weltevreden]|nr:hypothetical protein KCP76_13635 [Salmonella enterica subsp. enterica serovar Weltevreden]